MLYEFIEAWLKAPDNFNNKINSIFALYNLRYSVELISSQSTRIFYNKFLVLMSEGFRAVTFLSPSIYFSNLISVIFLPFWFMGILYFIKVGNFKIFIILFMVAIFVYLIGEKEIYYLLPIILFYIYFVFIGIKNLWSKN